MVCDIELGFFPVIMLVKGRAESFQFDPGRNAAFSMLFLYERFFGTMCSW
jgi:hypothetical protein